MEILGTGTGSPTASNWTRGPGPWLALFFLLFSAVGPAAAQSGTTPEYRLKAVLLFNFAQFVEWPPEAFAAPEAPLVIGILGDDPFGPVLDEIVQGEKIGSRSLVIQRCKRTEDITTCHILFVGRSDEVHLEQIAAQLKDRSVLTVSDSDAAPRRGMMIRFFADNRKIRLKINLEAAKAARLILSSKLLRPAEIVTGGGN